MSALWRLLRRGRVIRVPFVSCGLLASAACFLACGKAPSAVSSGAPGASTADAPAASASASVGATVPAASSAPKRPAGCWSNVSSPEPEKRLDALAVRCAQGFRPLLPAAELKAGGSVDVVLPPNTCARVIVVGDKADARLERSDGSVFARAQGEADAVLPEGGPFCTAKGETVKLSLVGSGRAAVYASP